MFAMPEATRMRSVAPSSTAPFENDSRVPSPSPYHNVSYPSSSISRATDRAVAAGATPNAPLQTPFLPSFMWSPAFRGDHPEFARRGTVRMTEALMHPKASYVSAPGPEVARRRRRASALRSVRSAGRRR